MTEGGILAAVLAVFAQIGTWITTTIPTFFTLFYAEGALTLLGTLAVAGLGMSVVFLLIMIIQRFLHFRG